MSDEASADPGLPIKLNPCSNGEFAPRPATPATREAVRRARASCDDNARRLGMDRRAFLRTSMAAATTLMAVSACADESSGGRAGGGYHLPEEATIDADAALDALGSDQPVVDVQTHLLEYPPGHVGGVGSMFPYAEQCGAEDPNECYRTEHWIEEVFGRSDTTVAILSAVPAAEPPDPLSAEVMAEARDRVHRLCGDGRVLVQGHAWPNVGPLDAALASMTEESRRFDLSGWKTYTHVGPGYMLDDSDGSGIGPAFLDHVERLGPPVLCVHKGLSMVGDADPGFASPADVGPAAAAHPDLTFCIYHAGFEPGVAEGPYDPAAPNGGVDRLVKSLEDAGIGPEDNVYVDLGSTWRFVMSSPGDAAHLLGKLLASVGEDRILWGSDSIWYGSPQDQIQAFRAFAIDGELQERYGYPALTDEVKHKVLWRNAARLYGIDVARVACDVDARAQEEARTASRLPHRTYGPTTEAAARRLFAAEHPWAVPPAGA
jgi:predicted TIM-barrel fold metal-dependent hydrolase